MRQYIRDRLYASVARSRADVRKKPRVHVEMSGIPSVYLCTLSTLLQNGPETVIGNDVVGARDNEKLGQLARGETTGKKGRWRLEIQGTSSGPWDG